MAAMTLSGFLRCSQRSMVVVLKDRFSREIQSTTLPRRMKSPGQVDPNYMVALVKLHGAILGATALVDAFPYTLPKFIRKSILPPVHICLIPVSIEIIKLSKQPSCLRMFLRHAYPIRPLFRLPSERELSRIPNMSGQLKK